MCGEYINSVLENLSNFDTGIRKKALLEIAEMVKTGQVKRSEVLKPWINLHLHTFHSYNYNNWSPARLVFEGWRTGLEYTGTVDFDTLAGLEETLVAGKLFGTRVTGGFEVRVFIEEMTDKVINSPKEPGIYYLCGKGFKNVPDRDSESGRFFLSLLEISQRRNKQVIARVNDYLKDLYVDYAGDVLPLTPSGNPTERHIIEAYVKKTEVVCGKKVDRFWSRVLSMPEEKVARMRLESRADFYESLRRVLIKYGGPGYIQPERESFPLFDDTVRMIEQAGGIPTGTWLDGTNPGESDPELLVSFLQSKGIKVITIIPDRNYNIPDPDEKKIKVQKLNEFMTVCRKKEVPVVCGTEMNRYGQPFVDDFNSPVLSPYLSYFLSSASVFRC